MNRGVVYALWDYDGESPDELSFKEGDCLTVLRREDAEETEWWWARCADNEGYIPRNLLGVRNSVQSYLFSRVYKLLTFSLFFVAVPENQASTEKPRVKSARMRKCGRLFQ